MESLLKKLTQNPKKKTLEFKLTQPKQTFSFKPSIWIGGCWNIGSTSLELYDSFFKITEEKNFKVFKLFDLMNERNIYECVRIDVAKKMGFSDITPQDLIYETIEPFTIEEYRKLFWKKRHNNPYIKLLAGYTRSIAQDFESFLRSELNLVEGDIRMVFHEYISGFITYEILAGFYTVKDLSDVFLRMELTKHGVFNLMDLTKRFTRILITLAGKPNYL